MIEVMKSICLYFVSIAFDIVFGTHKKATKKVSEQLQPYSQNDKV